MAFERTFFIAVFALINFTLFFEPAICIKKKIIDAVKICKRNDPNISECYKDNFQRLIPLMVDGIPEMNLLKIEPLHLDEVSLDFSESRSFRLETVLYNITMNGLSKGTLEDAKVEIVPNGMNSKLFIKIPFVEVASKYRAKGNFLLIGINSNGDFKGNFSGLDVTGTWNSHKYMKNGKEYLAFAENELDINVQSVKIHFDNLLGSNKELNENINSSINDNIDVLYEELKPIILQTIRALILKAVNNVFSLFPFDTLFPL